MMREKFNKFFKNDNFQQQINECGIAKEEIINQLEIFARGIDFVKLAEPATINNGVSNINKDEEDKLTSLWQQSALSGRLAKFVPASGAATRMFAKLLALLNQNDTITHDTLTTNSEDGNEFEAGLKFITNIKKFAFYNSLKKVMSSNKIDIDNLLEEKSYKQIFEYLLQPKGLNFVQLPKALIEFHINDNNADTPFEEQIKEAVNHTLNNDKTARIHFTISPDHENNIKQIIARSVEKYLAENIKLDITYSFQKKSTNTIAVNDNLQPFYDDNNKLVFRPGGHGALLENLNDLKADIIFIKNIDNVVPDHLRNETYQYKKLLAGFIIDLQNRTHNYLRTLENGNTNNNNIDGIKIFAQNKLSIFIVDDFDNLTTDEKVKFLFKRLNRPMRVCGMVKNEGEPGGGPFWVKDKKGNLSLQIIESSQIDPNNKKQKDIFESSTHFNPVDLVCAVKDYNGNNFDLLKYRDPSTAFISDKTKNGRPLKALELPGLWNGSMADWITIFVEVPANTFNPVKEVIDLLKPEHQPS